MRCLEGHLLLFLAFCSLAFPSSFSECFRQEHLERFWSAPAYEAENPYVYKLPLLRFYSFSFDNSSEGLALGGVSLADGSYFLSRLPAESRKDFASASSALDTASASLSGAKESQKSAHAASLAAQQLASAFFGRDYPMLFLPQPYQTIALLEIFLKASQAGYYAVAYPRLYGEALSLLSRLQAQSQPYSYADYQLFLSENSSCAALLSSAEQAQQAIMGENMTEAAGQLSSLSFALGESLSSAGDLAGLGEYRKAADAARKAQAEFRSSLSELAWKSSSEAADQYAKARKAQQGAYLPSAQEEIFNAQKFYSSGEHTQSFIASSRAKQLLLLGAESEQQSEAQAATQLQLLSQEFSALSGTAKLLLSKYSTQYSALSGQSKRRLALSPTDAQDRIDAAEKSFAAASKAKSGFQQALQQANDSYAKLAEAARAIQSALNSLQSSAESSVRVARLALSEVRQKAPESQESSQVEAEVSRAEDFMANSLYADALMSSDRAISAANLLLEQKAGAGLDQKSLLLAGASLAFMAAAAYYFSRKKKSGAKKERRVPRASDKPEI